MALLVDRFKRPRTLAVIGTVVLLIVLGLFGVLEPVERVTHTFIRPFQALATAITGSIDRISAPFNSITALSQENIALRQHNNQLLMQVAQLQQSLNLEEVVAQQFSYLTEHSFTFVPAKIIGKTNDPTFDSIIVNIGESKGVAVGQAVVIDEGIFIGTVRSVQAQHAEILLLNDQRSIVNAAITNEAGTQGVVSGQFSQSLIMDLIPQGDPISLNDVVVTRSDGVGVPNGLIIGKVVEIKNNPGQLFQSALVAPSVALEKASVVSIITAEQ